MHLTKAFTKGGRSSTSVPGTALQCFRAITRGQGGTGQRQDDGGRHTLVAHRWSLPVGQSSRSILPPPRGLSSTRPDGTSGDNPFPLRSSFPVLGRQEVGPRPLLCRAASCCAMQEATSDARQQERSGQAGAKYTTAQVQVRDFFCTAIGSRKRATDPDRSRLDAGGSGGTRSIQQASPREERTRERKPLRASVKERKRREQRRPPA